MHRIGSANIKLRVAREFHHPVPLPQIKGALPLILIVGQAEATLAVLVHGDLAGSQTQSAIENVCFLA